MKNLLITLLVVLAVLFGLLAITSRDSSKTFYDDVPHVNYEQITNDVVGTNLYYFYQDTCVHCNNIKEDVADFFYNRPEDIDFYAVDAADVANQDVWYQGDKESFVTPSGQVKDIEDIKIQGTPTLIEIKDGKITQFLVGETDIPAYLESLNA